jgi:hypothetical protein
MRDVREGVVITGEGAISAAEVSAVNNDGSHEECSDLSNHRERNGETVTSSLDLLLGVHWAAVLVVMVLVRHHWLGRIAHHGWLRHHIDNLMVLLLEEGHLSLDIGDFLVGSFVS